MNSPLESFNQIATLYPKEIAVIDEISSLTYEDLAKESNQLAHFFLSLKSSKGKRIGILSKRGCHLAKAILGVLKSGCVYVPLDPEYPAERIAYMISAAQINTIIVDNDSLSLLPKTLNLELIFLENWIPFASMSDHWTCHFLNQVQLSTSIDPKIQISPEDTLVILFTSGSTGQPKGVELSWAGYLNNFSNMQTLLQLKVGDKVAQMASQCFDISVTELWMPLLFGATVYVVSDQMKKNPWALAEWINHNEIRVIQFVPSLFHCFLSALEDDPIPFPTIKKLLFIGEALRSHLIKKWFSSFSAADCEVYNLYGPVEASIEVSFYKMDKDTDLKGDIVPIGKPFQGVEFHLKEEGAQKILHIKGIQLAKGYLNPEQTAKAFQNGMYCTGDVVELLASNDFLFLRRRDRQIKIRGFRVELDEIENTLITIPGINEAAVIVRRNNHEDKIIAYLQSANSEEMIKSFLQKKLPNYMIPHHIVFLEHLPLNQNGKVNYHALETIAS